jgi:hypothetical protein
VESLLAQAGGDLMKRPALEMAANLLGDATETRGAIGTQLGPYRIEALLGLAAWARSSRPATRAWDARSLSKLHRNSSARDSSMRLALSRH